MQRSKAVVLILLCCIWLCCSCTEKGQSYYDEAKSLYAEGSKLEALEQLELLLEEAPKSEYVEDAKNMYAYIVIEQMKEGTNVADKMINDLTDYLRKFIAGIKEIQLNGGEFEIDYEDKSLKSMNDNAAKLGELKMKLTGKVSQDILMEIDVNLLDGYREFIEMAGIGSKNFNKYNFMNMLAENMGSGRSYVPEVSDFEDSVEDLYSHLKRFNYKMPI